MITPGVDAQGNPIDPRKIQDHFEVDLVLNSVLFLFNLLIFANTYFSSLILIYFGERMGADLGFFDLFYHNLAVNLEVV